MIRLTKLNKLPFLLNCDLIETVESTPDTVIKLRNGKVLLVAESPERVAELVLAYRRSQYSELLKGVLEQMAHEENTGEIQEE